MRLETKFRANTGEDFREQTGDSAALDCNSHRGAVLRAAPFEIGDRRVIRPRQETASDSSKVNILERHCCSRYGRPSGGAA